jgi:hypothetical protein
MLVGGADQPWTESSKTVSQNNPLTEKKKKKERKGKQARTGDVCQWS